MSGFCNWKKIETGGVVCAACGHSQGRETMRICNGVPKAGKSYETSGHNDISRTAPKPIHLRILTVLSSGPANFDEICRRLGVTCEGNKSKVEFGLGGLLVSGDVKKDGENYSQAEKPATA